MRPNELALRLLWIFPPLKPGRIETIPRLVGGSVQARLTGARIYDTAIAMLPVLCGKLETCQHDGCPMTPSSFPLTQVESRKMARRTNKAPTSVVSIGDCWKFTNEKDA